MNLKDKPQQLRKTVLEMCIKAGTGHVTSSFSCVEIMVSLFYGVMKPEDVFILSKGQASPLYYAILADKGMIDEKELWKFATKEGALGVHLDHNIHGVVVTSGSLGHGLGIGAGIALSRKMDKKPGTVYVLLGDAECYEGSVWEAAMFAVEHELNNLVVFIDHNGWGVLTKPPQRLRDMWDGFGWDVKVVDGHNYDPDFLYLNTPTVIIARTIKGKGIPFMEDKYEWHGVAPHGEEAERASRELDGVVG